MKLQVLASAILTVAMAWGSCSAGGSTAPSYAPLRAQVDTLVVSSDNLPTPMKITVALPADYNTSTTSTYPVVYLLNGYSGGYRDYIQRNPLDSLATANRMIIVCPDGRDSWYWDSPVVKEQKMESFITKDIVKFIDDTLRTIPDRDHRAITGLSMGGHGALWLAMRHRDLFGSAGSMSGGVDITQPKFHNSWKMKRWLGEYDANPQRWADHTVINLVPTLNPGELNLIVSCGEDDFFYAVNNALDKALTDRGIDHVYSTTPGYGHSWSYWNMTLPTHLEFFKKQFYGE